MMPKPRNAKTVQMFGAEGSDADDIDAGIAGSGVDMGIGGVL